MAPVDIVRAAIVHEPIRGEEVVSRVGRPEDGAILLFLGVVRDENEGRPVGGLEYQVYEEMAGSVLGEISGEAAGKMTSGRLAVVHRVGELAVGETSVAIAVSAPHRDEAYSASRHLIEEIKKRLPIWKKERYLSGETGWVSGRSVAPPAVPNPSAGAGEGPVSSVGRAAGGPVSEVGRTAGKERGEG